MHSPYIGESRKAQIADLIGASLQWQRTRIGWRLYTGRRMGDVVPDGTHPNMWRIVLHDGRLSDMANLSWARNAVLEAATRELEYEARAIDPTITRDSGGVFSDSPSLVRRQRKNDAGQSPGPLIAPDAAALKHRSAVDVGDTLPGCGGPAQTWRCSESDGVS